MEDVINTVCVYMSTYNGEQYIAEQIDSILKQIKVKIILCIRDDGSKDRTVPIIERYIKDGNPIILECGENVGFQKSFSIVSQKRINADYYAFSDQDDVWKKEKLIRAIEMIGTNNIPTLYGGNIIVTDENLQNIGVWCDVNDYGAKKERIRRYFSLGYNLYGCSMVWNLKLQELVWNYIPYNFVSHDVYMTILAGALGEIIVDIHPMTFHRIHKNNTAGIEHNMIRRGLKGYRLYFGKGHRELSKVAGEILEGYKTWFEKDNNYGMENLMLIANYKKNKMKFIKHLDIKILGKKGYLWILLLSMFNKY